jgi:hypothetical protein
VAGRGIEADSRPRAMISAPRKTRMRADPWRHQLPPASRHTLMAWPRQNKDHPGIPALTAGHPELVARFQDQLLSTRPL